MDEFDSDMLRIGNGVADTKGEQTSAAREAGRHVTARPGQSLGFSRKNTPRDLVAPNRRFARNAFARDIRFHLSRECESRSATVSSSNAMSKGFPTWA